MNIGDKVKITGTNSVFDDKEGIIEDMQGEGDNSTCTVFVDFIPEDNKKIRQNFSIKNILKADSINYTDSDENTVEMPKNDLKDKIKMGEGVNNMRRLTEADEKVIKEVDWNGHHFIFTNTFYNTGTKSHDVLTMEDENGNEWTGETTWINRPWHRFDLEEAFDEIVEKAFGGKALKLVQEIDNQVGSVEKAIEEFFKAFKPEDIEHSEKEVIDDSEEGRKNALAKHFDVSPDEIEEEGDNEFSFDEGTFKVLTDEEADEEFEDAVRNLWEEGGIDYVSGWLKDWILENALNDNDFEDFVREDESNQVYDMDDDEVVEECIDNNIVNPEDVYDEEDDSYTFEIKDDVDVDNLREKLIDYRVENILDNYSFGEYLDNLGFDSDYIQQYIDDDKAVEAIKDDIDTNGQGRGQEIAYYDGNEIELDNGLFAYRTN